MAITHDKEHVHSRDPITKAPDFHPVGTGIGAAAGGVAAGAAVGTVAGPVGTLVGAAVGAVVGGLAGKAAAHRIDSDMEDAYWQENYSSRSYVNPDATYDDYRPAYRFGVNSYSKIPVVHSTTWTVSCVKTGTVPAVIPSCPGRMPSTQCVIPGIV